MEGLDRDQTTRWTPNIPNQNQRIPAFFIYQIRPPLTPPQKKTIKMLCCCGPKSEPPMFFVVFCVFLEISLHFTNKQKTYVVVEGPALGRPPGKPVEIIEG